MFMSLDWLIGFPLNFKWWNCKIQAQQQETRNHPNLSELENHYVPNSHNIWPIEAIQNPSGFCASTFGLIHQISQLSRALGQNIGAGGAVAA